MDLVTQLLTAVAVILLVPIYFYYKNTYRVVQFLKKFPTPPTVPFFGNALDFSTSSDFLKSLHRYTKTHGSMIHLQIGPAAHSLLTSDYKFLEFLLSSNTLLKKSFVMKFLEPWLGTSLAIADGGPKWRMHRKLITPAFHFKILEQFVDIFESGGNILVERLSKLSGERSVDIYPIVARCTLKVIHETAMGTKLNVQEERTASYFQSAKDMSRIFLARGTSFLKSYDFLFRFTADYQIQQKAVEVLHGYTNQVINARREELKNTTKEQASVDDLGRKKRKVFLDLILGASVDGQALSDEEIREEVDTFMFGGHDTTATAASFILYCLANNKDAQDQTLEEQQQLFGDDKNPKVTYSDLQEMKYLDKVIKEGLRMYSPAPIFGRVIDQDVVYDGMTIPKGLNVIVFAHGIHMNPKYYPNPERFDPSRFDDVDGKLPYAYIPFSAGPRNCIGQKYAILELKSLISKIVRNFELMPAFPKHEMKLAAEIVLKSCNGVKIGLKLR